MTYNMIDIRPHRRAKRTTEYGSAVGRVWFAYKKAVVRKKSIRALESLSDAQLYDIGIPRYAIKDVIDANLKGVASEKGVVEPTISKITPVEVYTVPQIRIAAWQILI